MTSPAPANAVPLRVLLVDDEELVRASLSAILKAEGYQTSVAPNAEEALELVRRDTFALLLTDQRMPGLTGLEFLAQAKTLQPDATRVLMTGVLELNTIVESINTGEIFRFIIKPWMREELLATVKNGVQRYELMVRNSALHESTLAMNKELSALNQALAQEVQHGVEQNRQLELLNHALEQNLYRSVELCLKTMETFYPALGVEARKACELCQALGEGLQLSAEQRQVLELSALLHDIGLVGVPRRIIKLAQQSPGTLSGAELALIHHHPVLGQELAGFVHHLADVGMVIRAHHERFDGRGYPDGVAGEEIPWLARLLAVAICFAESLEEEPVIRESIERGSGSQFDPEAVRAVLRSRALAGGQWRARKQREVLLAELEPGMVLAKGIYNPNGLLLIPEGQLLNEMQIDKLRNHNRLNPIRDSLMVYC